MRIIKSGTPTYQMRSVPEGNILGEWGTRGEMFAAARAVNKLVQTGAVGFVKVVPIVLTDEPAPAKPKTK